ncbi:hypothetical protein, partial [Treponema sp. R6D11]
HITHVREVLDTPEAFGYTKEELVAIYKKFKEPLGLEGKARNQIIETLLGRGWIRLRYVPKNDVWTIELSRLRRKQKEFLWAWATDKLNASPVSRYQVIKIIMLDIGVITEISLEDMAGSKLLAVSMQKNVKPLIAVNSGAELLDISPSARTERLFNCKDVLSRGVWISPSGDMFGIPLTHVIAVIDDPDKFGLSMEQIKSVYNKFNEGLGSEGKARDEIVSMLISNGWVRIRYYPGEYFHVELKQLTPPYKEYLSTWASRVIAKNPEKASIGVSICEKVIDINKTTLTLMDVSQLSHNSALKMNFPPSPAYWLSSRGEVFGVHGSHASTVIERHDVFGLSKDEAEELFKYGEEDAILKRLINVGWTRIRFQRTCYFISVKSLSAPVKGLLTSWVLRELDLHKKRGATFAVIEEIGSNHSSKVSLLNMSKGVFTHDDSLAVSTHESLDYGDWSVFPPNSG